MSLYAGTQQLVRSLWRLVGGLDVRGRDNVPESGPFLLVANHQSYLDPFLIQAVCPRPVAAMAKSTQFNSAPYRIVMTRFDSFPVRRFQVDPQAVRVVLRRLASGEGVAIYVEGERSWDARLQPPRRGTLHLVLRAGVPVVPTAISGTYDALPRWQTRLRRSNVRVDFGEPLRFPALRDRAERERRLPETADVVMGAIQRLLDRQGSGG